MDSASGTGGGGLDPNIVSRYLVQDSLGQTAVANRIFS